MFIKHSSQKLDGALSVQGITRGSFSLIPSSAISFLWRTLQTPASWLKPSLTLNVCIVHSISIFHLGPHPHNPYAWSVRLPQRKCLMSRIELFVAPRFVGPGQELPLTSTPQFYLSPAPPFRMPSTWHLQFLRPSGFCMGKWLVACCYISLSQQFTVIFPCSPKAFIYHFSIPFPPLYIADGIVAFSQFH